MKLGKALATGVAEERPLVREETVRDEAVREEQAPLAEEAARVEAAEPAREEVPAAR
ncbi:hypothetical protein [Streptomyces alanosinicus]|uniref:Uncharacterized protein n=1 Tax=Streptomyces alanosinicus TaxID=68171 RepID=A0A918YBQ0_9ACTN|nr:hypothetical protein [Streptomyces alanosinicus]GHD97512.1 hypothetical protein GCM10010339_00080 [Streptomyces alanosinicus]